MKKPPQGRFFHFDWGGTGLTAVARSAGSPIGSHNQESGRLEARSDLRECEGEAQGRAE